MMLLSMFRSKIRHKLHFLRPNITFFYFFLKICHFGQN